jgi:polysaccharide pyruvyl transferase WcaK-like protein
MLSRIGIWGHYHGKNLGDDIVVATIAENLRRRLPDVELVGYSLNPVDTARRHGFPAYSLLQGTRFPVAVPEGSNGSIDNRSADDESTSSGPAATATSDTGTGAPAAWSRIRRIVASNREALGRVAGRLGDAVRSMWRMRESLREVDLLIVAGSGPFFDGWDGPWTHPYNLYRWSQLSRTTGTDFVPLSVGGGPVDEPITQFFLRHSLNTSAYKSYRDPHSATLARSLGARGPHPIFPDLAFGLSPAVLQEAHQNARDLSKDDGTLAVGISTMAHKDPRHMPRGADAVFESYLRKIADVAAWVAEEGMIPILLRSDRGDDPVAEDIVHLLRKRGVDIDTVLVPPTETYVDLLVQMAACDVVVGGRFHCHVLPMMLGVPVLGLAYHPKTWDMMAYMGQAEHCMDIDRSSASDIIAGVERLLADRASVSGEVAARAAFCREAVATQYDALIDGTTAGLVGSYLPDHDSAPAVEAR